MPAKEPLSLLFHPKKNANRSKSTAAPLPKPARAGPSHPRPAPPKPETDDADGELALPEGPFQEFRLLSSALNGWKYDVMKFDSRKPVDLQKWQEPIKLNRKDLRREDPSAPTGPQILKPMLGLDGNQVFGMDGKPVMVDMEGKIFHEGDNGKSKAPANKKKFQRKTRQVYKVPEEVRQLRREERYPWVIEDGSGGEVWTAQLEDLGKAETHAFFMPAANDSFKFVPAHRWYKFQKKLKHDMPTDTVTMESAFLKSQKRDPQAWLSARNGGKGPSAATAATFKAEAEGRTVNGESSLVHDSGRSMAPGGRKLKAVDSGMDLFGDDEDDKDAKRRREKEYGGEGDMDEMVYEEDFADDDEKVEAEGEDDEAKEIEERLKKEYKTANKTQEGYIDESDDEDTPGKTKQERAMQKLIRNREGNDAYDSDEDNKNPYASSEDEEEEEELPPPPPPPPPPIETPNVTEAADTAPGAGPAKLQTDMRAVSPVSPSLGGHSIVAKRATSPKAPKLKTGNGSRASSPLGSRANSPPAPGSRATSPIPIPGSRAASPTLNSPLGSQKKRKADESQTNNGTPKPKKRKTPNPAAAPAGELEDRMVIEWLKNTPNAKTRDCIQYFTPYLTDEAKKGKFTALVKEVAQLKNGILVLRSAFRDSATPG